MNWVKVIGFLVKYGPTIFSVVKEVVELIREIKDDAEKKRAMRGLSQSVKASCASRDIKPVEAYREKIKTKVERGRP